MLARIPSVSAPAFDPQQVARSADAIAELLRAEGMQVQIVTAGGHPAVIGRTFGPPQAPRVLLYAHHDVQPPGEQGWLCPPFEPTQRGERLYGRGVADDKAGVMAHLAAIRALRDVDGQVPVSLTLFIEGEEESGSESLPGLLAAHAAELDCDVIVLADSMNWAVGTPSLTTTLRGCVRAVVSVRTLSHGVHSGMFGGVAPDAVSAMCRLLACLHEPDGSVAVPGLLEWDDSALDYPEADVRRDSGMLDGVALLGRGSITSRLWTQPSITVTGIDVPDVASSVNVLLPQCRAMVSMRIAPTQDPELAFQALAEHLQANAPWGAEVSVAAVDLGHGFQASTRGRYAQAARAAFEQAWGRPPVDIGIGGSIPFIALFAEAFPAATILVTGVEDPDSRAHGANESLHLGEFERVCLAETFLLDRLGRLDRQEPPAP